MEVWEDFRDKAVSTLKDALADLWDKTKDAEPFYKSVAEDIAKQTALMLKEQNPLQRKVHEDNIQFLISTAYLRALKLGLKAGNLAEDVAKRVLETALTVAAGLLKRLIPIPIP
jgi:hypothetical protein